MSGIEQVLTRATFYHLTPQYVKKKVSAPATLSVDKMKKQFHVDSKMGDLKKWFWKLVTAMTNKERQELLRFMSGSSSL
jgi:hypothetical protein